MIGPDIQDKSLKAIDLNFILNQNASSASTEPQSFLCFPVWHEVVEKLKEDTAIGNGKPHCGHIIRKRLGSSQENVRLESLPSSLVKPHNLPITRIAPGDVISVDAKIKPLKIEGSIDLQKKTFSEEVNQKRRVEGMSQTPQMFTKKGDKPQQTDCLDLLCP